MTETGDPYQCWIYMLVMAGLKDCMVFIDLSRPCLISNSSISLDMVSSETICVRKYNHGD